MATTAFVKDDRVENWLASQNVTYTGPISIKIADFDTRESRRNQARAEALVDEAVDAYNQSIRNGDKLPALVAYKRGTKYIIIDGNNRLEGARKAGQEKVACYVISSELSSEAILLLTLSANATNGVPVSREWKLLQATTLMAHGYTKDITAKALKLSASSIDGYIRANEADDRARRLRVSNWNTIPTTTRETIARVRLDPVFVLVAETVITYQIKNTPELRTFLASVNRAASETDAIDMVTAWSKTERENAAQLRRLGRVRGVTNPKLSVLTALGKIEAFNLSQFNTVFSAEEDRTVLSNRVRKSILSLLEMEYKMHDANNVQDWLITEIAKIGS